MTITATRESTKLPERTRASSADRWTLALRHRERLLRIARYRLRDDQDAEDFVHEALVRCVTFEALDELRIGEFLTSTLVRLCIDAQRRASRIQRLAPYLGADVATPDPVEAAGNVAVGRRLLQAASSLRGREREVLLARASGFSTAQAALQLGISLKAAEGAFTRGRARLRALCSESI